MVAESLDTRPPRAGHLMPPDDPVGEIPASLAQRRRRALVDVRAELYVELSALTRRDATGVLCGYGPGCLVVGIASPVDRAMADRLRRALDYLCPHSSRELILLFAGPGPWNRHLVRVVGQVRITHLLAGGRVELHDAPRELVVDLGQALPTTFAIHDNSAAHPPARPDGPDRGAGSSGSGAGGSGPASRDAGSRDAGAHGLTPPPDPAGLRVPAAAQRRPVGGPGSPPDAHDWP